LLRVPATGRDRGAGAPRDGSPGRVGAAGTYPHRGREPPARGGQQLAARSTELDRREAEHEQRITAEVEAAHHESARLLDAAVAEADAIRRAVIVETDRLRADAVAEVVARTRRGAPDQAWSGLLPRPGTGGLMGAEGGTPEQ
jgi:nucleoid-associated protein YgaU